MSGEQVPVSVAEDVAIEMAEHMHEQGRGGLVNPQTSQLMAAKLGQAVALAWGVRAKRFEDGAGGGWICDVSSALEGELKYAVIRSEAGTRRVMECVDEDVAISMTEGGKRPDTASTVTAAAPRETPAPPVAPRELPGAPRLIVYWEPVEGGGDEIGPVSIMRTTYSEAQSKVLPLLMRGCRVEVWSGQKTPTITVDL